MNAQFTNCIDRHPVVGICFIELIFHFFLSVSNFFSSSYHVGLKILFYEIWIFYTVPTILNNKNKLFITIALRCHHQHKNQILSKTFRRLFIIYKIYQNERKIQSRLITLWDRHSIFIYKFYPTWNIRCLVLLSCYWSKELWMRPKSIGIVVA